MTTSEVTLLFEYVNRVEELKRIVANQIERIANLQAIAQALADELIDADNVDASLRAFYSAGVAETRQMAKSIIKEHNDERLAE